ncbi:GrpB family protein [Streptomyces sp. NPDC058583]|uniref:GrpB family protein n=1 Tax=unclassified Streptomyces TaxID=2593676 RepID=UPI003653BF59
MTRGAERTRRAGNRFRSPPYDPAWPAVFAIRGECLRAALGDAAPSIGHIGATSVPGLTAKPVIDIQISVASLEPADPFLDSLTGMGLVHRAGNAERTKRRERTRKARDSARRQPENSEGGAGVVQGTWRGLDNTKAPGR